MGKKRDRRKQKQAKRQSRRQNLPGQRLQDALATAVRFHQEGNLPEAERRYLAILDKEPNHIDALHLRGVIAHQAGKDDIAVELIGRAIAIDRSQPRFHNNLGSVLKAQGDVDGAAERFKEALRLNPDYPDACNNLGNCLKEKNKLDEAIDLYKRAIELNPEYAEAHNNLGNAFKDTKAYAEAVTHFKKAIALRPNLAEPYHNIGNIQAELGELKAAAENYRKAIAVRPDFVEAHNNLGNVLEGQGDIEAAAEHYQKAVQTELAFDRGHYNLGNVLGEQGKYGQAVEQYNEALRSGDVSAEAHNNLGNALKAQGKYEEAIEHYRKALEISPDMVEPHYNMGMAMLTLGRFEDGWREYEWRFKSKEILSQIDERTFAQSRWDGSPFPGRTVLVYSEQGIGDAIQFVRYLPLVKERGGRVIFECNKGIAGLVRSFSGIDLVVERSDCGETGEPFDLYVPLLSLPMIFDTTVETIIKDTPYLVSDPELVCKWGKRLGDGGFKVGLVWAGNPAHRNDRNRSCRLVDFAPLASVAGVTLFSLQKGAGCDQLSNTPDGMEVVDIGGELGDFSDTAAVIANLDLVISVDTSVAHLAGALGRPVWTLLPFEPDWRWMTGREDTPWYPTMRLYRQTARADWGGVMADVRSELARLAGGVTVADVGKNVFAAGHNEGDGISEICLVMPIGAAHGWGVCGKYVAYELDKIPDLNLRLVTEAFTIKDVWDRGQYDALSRCLWPVALSNCASDPADRGVSVDAPVIQAIEGGSLQPWSGRLKGSVTIGYTFFENNILSKDDLRRAGDYFDVIASGSTWCTEILNSYGFSRTKTVLQGIDPHIFYPGGRKERGKDSFTIFSGGKFEYRKGHDLAIKAVKVLQDRHKDVVLVAAWHNQWPDTMKSMAASPYIEFEMHTDDCRRALLHILAINGLDMKRTVCLPQMPNGNMPDVYRNSDIGLFPNRCEGGTNLVLMEYMACGRPVVASYLTGQKDVLDENYAAVVSGGRVIDIKQGDDIVARWEEPELDEIVAHLEWAYHNRDKIEAMGEMAGDAMLRFTWKDTARTFYDMTLGCERRRHGQDAPCRRV